MNAPTAAARISKATAPNITSLCSMRPFEYSHKYSAQDLSDFEHVIELSPAAWRFLAALQWRSLLLFADELQRSAQPLVVDHGRVGNATHLVEGGIGQVHTFIADRQAP